MTKVIRQYAVPVEQLGPGGSFELDTPAGRVLHVALSGTWIYLWALVCPDAQSAKRRFRLLCTNEPIEDIDRLRYCGSASLDLGGGCHLFEVAG